MWSFQDGDPDCAPDGCDAHRRNPAERPRGHTAFALPIEPASASGIQSTVRSWNHRSHSLQSGEGAANDMRDWRKYWNEREVAPPADTAEALRQVGKTVLGTPVGDGHIETIVRTIVDRLDLLFRGPGGGSGVRQRISHLSGRPSCSAHPRHGRLGEPHRRGLRHVLLRNLLIRGRRSHGSARPSASRCHQGLCLRGPPAPELRRDGHPSPVSSISPRTMSVTSSAPSPMCVDSELSTTPTSDTPTTSSDVPKAPNRSATGGIPKNSNARLPRTT
jgi:hypothetical protein